MDSEGYIHLYVCVYMHIFVCVVVCECVCIYTFVCVRATMIIKKKFGETEGRAWKHWWEENR